MPFWSFTTWFSKRLLSSSQAVAVLLHETEEGINGFLHFFLVRPGMQVLVVVLVSLRCLVRLRLGPSLVQEPPNVPL